MTGFTKRVARIAALTVLAGLLTTGAVRAQVGDILSSSKGQVESFGGALDDGEGSSKGLGNFSGSFTIPLIGGFNIQTDGLIGGSGNTNWAVSGHLYWYDKDIGLVDLNLSHLDFKTRGITRLGLHGQYFLGLVTIKGNIGYQFLTNGGRDSIYGSMTAEFFATPNLKLQVGGSGYRNQGIGFGHIEYLVPLNRLFGPVPKAVPPLSVWVNGGAGNNRYWHVVAGIRLSFGCAGTLIALSRNCGTTNHLPRWIMTLRPAARDDGERTGPGVTVDPFAGSGPSDRLIKTDIVRIGTLPNGIGLYHFRYILGGSAHLGVMVQDVLKVRPDAVSVDTNGLYLVNYRALGIRMVNLD